MMRGFPMSGNPRLNFLYDIWDCVILYHIGQSFDNCGKADG